MQRRAYIFPEGMFKLGALFELEGRIYSATGVMSADVSTDWQDKLLFPMEILHGNSARRAREQSGIKDEGPIAVLIGAGSLGSALISLWGRSGWGTWTVVDKDHIKPHNISRHIAIHDHIGALKAQVVAHIHELATDGASQIRPICADACDLDSEPILTLMRDARLIVDASTTLEYPRLSSTRDDIGRHVSVFITPSGNDAVMLMEDATRMLRLRTLEAQYYRAVLNESWGATHLPKELGTFWSGASCRDLSSVLPYSRILAHAGTLAEQIQQTSTKEDAAIRVWSRSSDTGAVVAYNVPVFAGRSLMDGAIDVFIDDGLEQKLQALRESMLPRETGGVLLGYYDFNERFAVVVDALPAPSDSDSAPSYFERGTEGLKESVAEASRRTAGIVGYIGEWHSHPRCHSADPSPADVRQLFYLANQLAEDGVPAIQLIVGERDLKATAGWIE